MKRYGVRPSVRLSHSGLYLTGVGEVEPPAKISDPPAAIKKRKGGVDFKHFEH